MTGPSGANIVGGNDKTFIGPFLTIYHIQLPLRPISTANQSDPRNLIKSSEMTNNCMVQVYRSIKLL